MLEPVHQLADGTPIYAEVVETKSGRIWSMPEPHKLEPYLDGFRYADAPVEDSTYPERLAAFMEAMRERQGGQG